MSPLVPLAKQQLGEASPSCSPLAPWRGPPLPVLRLPGRAGPHPCLVTPRPGLSTPPASCPTVGQAAALGCAHAACGCAQLCGRCLATQKGTHRPQWGHRVEGCMEGSIPAHCLHSPGVLCICACPRTPHLCPCCVCEGHTRVHTCALSACVLCHQIPLPVQATCLPPSPFAGFCAWWHPRV